MEKITLENFIQNFKLLLIQEENILELTEFKKLKSWDSLFMLELIMMFDEKYNLKITADLINDSITIIDLYNKIKEINNSNE